MVFSQLNWYFDERPDQYLIQKPRTVYDSEGNARTTVRYLIKQREQAESEESNHENNYERTEERKNN